MTLARRRSGAGEPGPPLHHCYDPDVRRADRLFKLIQRLRRRRAQTAAQLAASLEVSERTVYRDIRDLQDSGVPILGEPGVGYLLQRGYDLPPLMFDGQEIEALVLGARIVRGWADPALAAAADDALSKIAAVVPAERRQELEATALFALNFRSRPRERDTLSALRRALRERRKAQLAYRDAGERESGRVVRPLGLFYWGSTWTLGAWCELRTDFRNFRLDRVTRVEILDQRFGDEAGKTLADMFRRYEEEDSSAAPAMR